MGVSALPWAEDVELSELQQKRQVSACVGGMNPPTCIYRMINPHLRQGMQSDEKYVIPMNLFMVKPIK